MKKIIIFKHGGGELANQLWNYASIYAWGLEEKCQVINPSFYEYHSYFNFLGKESFITGLLSKLFLGYNGRKQNIWKKSWRLIYALCYSKPIEIFKSKKIIHSENPTNNAIHLLPTVKQIQTTVELAKSKNVYMSGWLFRNPAGLDKYRNEIIKAFAPRSSIVNKVNSIIDNFRKQYAKIIGIHIRQWDYKTWKGGRFFISQKRIRGIIDEYIKLNNLDLNSTLFLIMSDGDIDQKCFEGLNIYISRENAVTDLFLLSRTDTIIGADSSFGHFASWCGNIPHIVMKNEPMDWGYYKDRTNYFQNKYCAMVHF